MSSFRTEFNTRLHNTIIPIPSQMLTIGSCFSENIGRRLADNKFRPLINPFGTVYNPVSIHKLIQMAIHNQLPSSDTYLINEDVHSNYDFHSSLSAIDQDELKERIKQSIESTHQFLLQCDFLFITYGTSWVYQRKENKAIVANCHKQPSSLFQKLLLDQQSIEQSFNEMYADLKKFNPNIKVILTLSPVRHLKDTIELNSVSKSILRVACHSITKAHDNVEYFGAYEIMMDDLRDYRFYASDMIHPSLDAENYIWDKFSDTYFSLETKAVLSEWQAVKRMMNHRPFQPDSVSHKAFLKDVRAKLEALHQKLDVSEELNQYL